MSNDPWHIRLLEKMGVNVTRMRWKLYQKEQQLKQGVGPKGPAWWKYQHKVCPKCTALNDGDSRHCHSCQTPLPPMRLYKVQRIFRRTDADGPIVVPVFFGLIFLFFILEVTMGGFSVRSVMAPHPNAMKILGAFTVDIFSGPFHAFRWMAFGLLHGGIMHIGFNAYAFRNVGPFIENEIGAARMLVLITATQLGSAAAAYIQYFMIDQYHLSGRVDLIVVGASGWIFGLIGFGIVMFHKMGQISIRNQLLFWSGLMLFIGYIVPGISNSAHIGGMVSGCAVALLPAGGNLRKPAFDRAWNSAAVACAFLWVLTIICMFISLALVGPEYF